MDTSTHADRRALAERVRAACVAAARTAFADAAASGLCGEGALEAALGAIQTLELETLLDAPHQPPPRP